MRTIPEWAPAIPEPDRVSEGSSTKKPGKKTATALFERMATGLQALPPDPFKCLIHAEPDPDVLVDQEPRFN
jgi:hypothetical protein